MSFNLVHNVLHSCLSQMKSNACLWYNPNSMVVSFDSNASHQIKKHALPELREGAGRKEAS